MENNVTVTGTLFSRKHTVVLRQHFLLVSLPRLKSRVSPGEIKRRREPVWRSGKALGW